MEARLASWEFTFHITVPARWGVRGSVPRFHSQFYTVKMIFHASWRVFHFNNATFQYFSSRAQLKFSLFVSPELTAKRSRWWLSILFINTHLSTLFRCCFWYNIIHFSLSLSLSFPTVFISFWWLWKMRYLKAYTQRCCADISFMSK